MLDRNELNNFIKPLVEDFHREKLVKLEEIKLKTIIARKNPYLFKAKNITTANDMVVALLEAYLSSSEETLFGKVVEKLAIYCSTSYGQGRKSASEGIDLEMDVENTRYLVAVKSGPNWGNSSQISKMINNFNRAKQVLMTTGGGMNVDFVNGCCYGKTGKNPYKEKGYYKYCGQKFWEFISGDESLYLSIIEPLGHEAKERNELFKKEYPQVINRFTREFIEDFCGKDGSIKWDKLVRFNSNG